MDAKFQILKFHTLKFRPKFPQNFVTPILYIETSNVRMSRQNLPAKNMASRQDILVGDTRCHQINHHIPHSFTDWPRLAKAPPSDSDKPDNGRRWKDCQSICSNDYAKFCKGVSFKPIQASTYFQHTSATCNSQSSAGPFSLL